MKTFLKPDSDFWRALVLPLLLLLLWSAAVRWQWVQSPILVAPSAVASRALEQLRTGALWQALAASLYRDVWGFLIGSSAGLLFGSWLGWSRWAERLLGPSFHTLKQISLFAWIPLLSVWFGLGDAAKIAFVAMAAFFPVVLNTIEGFRSVPHELIEVGRVLALRRWQLWRKLILPAALPSIFTGIHLALIYSWLATLGAEYLLVSGKGIGNTLIDGREHFWMDLVLFGIVVIGLVGYVLNHGLGRIEHRLLAWRHPISAHY